nr:hypothetical protein [Tanacetum cinerariifolium]
MSISSKKPTQSDGAWDERGRSWWIEMWKRKSILENTVAPCNSSRSSSIVGIENLSLIVTVFKARWVLYGWFWFHGVGMNGCKKSCLSIVDNELEETCWVRGSPRKGDIRAILRAMNELALPTITLNGSSGLVGRFNCFAILVCTILCVLPQSINTVTGVVSWAVLRSAAELVAEMSCVRRSVSGGWASSLVVSRRGGMAAGELRMKAPNDGTKYKDLREEELRDKLGAIFSIFLK